MDYIIWTSGDLTFAINQNGALRSAGGAGSAETNNTLKLSSQEELSLMKQTLISDHLMMSLGGIN